MSEKKNKIDSVVDEVIDSKRVKQASYGLLKMIRVVAILGIIFCLVLAFIGHGDDTLFGGVYAGVLFLIFLIVNNIINKKMSL